ncbi:MAG: DUF362 domain-containing protein [Anaerolineae bacterium]|nr:DUF362 domain-containing protein [Anaerolineae bacterium]
MTDVAFVKTQDRAEGVRRAVAMVGMPDVQGKRVFVKPNYNSAGPPPGSTHEDVLRVLLTALRDGGAAEAIVGERSGMGETRDVLTERGVFALAEELGAQVLVLDELDEQGWVKVEAPDAHWRRGFAIARAAVEADVVIQACCLKTHRFGGHFTLSLKNAVGLVAERIPGELHNYMHELHTSRHQRLMIAEIITAYTPDLIVLDGVEAFVRGGPARGKRVDAGVVLAGRDRIAVDAVGVALLRHFGTTHRVERGPVFSQAQIARAVELGLGVASAQEIRIITDHPESEAFAEQIRQILLAP